MYQPHIKEDGRLVGPSISFSNPVCPAAEKKKTAVGQFFSCAHFIHIYGGFDDSKPPFSCPCMIFHFNRHGGCGGIPLCYTSLAEGRQKFARQKKPIPYVGQLRQRV
jgi:hypothetical protein